MSSYFDSVFYICRSQGCELLVEHKEGEVSLVISDPATGPVVRWTAFSGSIEETARYALASATRIQRERGDCQ